MKPFQSLRLLFLLPVFAATLSAQSVPALRDRLQDAAQTTSLNTEGLTPWHLKVDLQLFDAKGKPTDKAAIEEWWQSPKVHRVDYILPSGTVTELRNLDGAFHTPNHAPVPYLLETLLRQMIHPMPTESDLNAATPEFQKKSFGKIALECVMLDHVTKLNGDAHVFLPTKLPLGIFPTYCFDPGATSLRVTYDMGSEAVVRNGVGTFQKRSVATKVTIYEGAAKAVSGQVSRLSAGEPTPADFFAAGPELQPIGDATPVQGGIIAGYILNKPPPVYPQSAKESHISGDVVLHAIIGRDGHIRSLQLLSTPDGDLALASLIAVRDWTYKPYLLNGEPTEVDTTITVHFRLG